MTHIQTKKLLVYSIYSSFILCKHVEILKKKINTFRIKKKEQLITFKCNQSIFICINRSKCFFNRYFIFIVFCMICTEFFYCYVAIFILKKRKRRNICIYISIIQVYLRNLNDQILIEDQSMNFLLSTLY
jgi:hypothetical protein